METSMTTSPTSMTTTHSLDTRHVQGPCAGGIGGMEGEEPSSLSVGTFHPGVENTCWEREECDTRSHKNQ